ncbi:hypothetical protein L3Q82_010193, partial [Scortum barcoo]
LALFFNNASCPLNLEATTQRDALLHPLFSSWVTVGSHVTASCMYLALPAGEEAGNARHSRAALYPMGDNGRRAERQGCAPGHVPHQHIAPRPRRLDRKQPFLSSPSSPCREEEEEVCYNYKEGLTKPTRPRENGGDRGLPLSLLTLRFGFNEDPLTSPPNLPACAVAAGATVF